MKLDNIFVGPTRDRGEIDAGSARDRRGIGRAFKNNENPLLKYELNGISPKQIIKG